MNIGQIIEDYMNEWLLYEDSNTLEAWNAVKLAVLDSVEGVEHD